MQVSLARLYARLWQGWVGGERFTSCSFLWDAGVLKKRFRRVVCTLEGGKRTGAINQSTEAGD